VSEANVYRDQVLEVEPTGIEVVTPEQRHGSPRQLFWLWFSANAEIATWMVGVFAVSLYGTSLAGASLGLVVGNLLGFALLGILATFGPRYGVPQMVASRLAFGRYGNALPAGLSFLAGVGWFAINTVFGAYALETITHLGYAFSLALMLLAQILLAVYGYNLIHWFERVSAVLLAGGFALLGYVTFSRADWHAVFNAHAPLSAGGEIGGIILATALGFSYATGWVPCASDYSRYLPETTNPRSVWWYSFLGCALPCIVLEIMGAATVTAVRGANLADASPTHAIASLLGSSTIATLVLLTVTLGTLTANCMNLYSGAMAALVVKFPDAFWRGPLVTALIFGALTAAIFSLAHTAAGITIVFSLAAAAVIATVAHVRLARWRAAVVVGILGALLASGGGHPEATARLYTNFLLLLSYWASPWAAVVFVDWLQRLGTHTRPSDFENGAHIRAGTYAWILGLAASLPFWNQAWYAGPFARMFPQFGDLSYYVGFAVAALVMAAAGRETTPARQSISV
jgi:nucleobase:cation symporter-1, NCS1 family